MVTAMQTMWWILSLLGVVGLILLFAPLDSPRDRRLRARARQIGMERRLRRFEAQQRVRQQEAVMQRTREINALAHQTCQAMVRAALEAQREELSNYDQ